MSPPRVNASVPPTTPRPVPLRVPGLSRHVRPTGDVDVGRWRWVVAVAVFAGAQAGALARDSRPGPSPTPFTVAAAPAIANVASNRSRQARASASAPSTGASSTPASSSCFARMASNAPTINKAIMATALPWIRARMLKYHSNEKTK